jgi:AraC-like DNA-binding protein
VGARHDRPSESHVVASGADPLSDVLHSVSLTGALFFLVDVASPWAADVPAADAFASIILPDAEQIVSYHIVTRGPCWGALHDGPPVRLETGDILLIPHGDPYAIWTGTERRAAGPVEEALAFFKMMAAGQQRPVRREGAGAERLRLVCGFLGCDVRPFNPVVAALPRLVRLRPPPSAADRLGHLIEYALAESEERRSGGRSVLLRLSELMFVEVVRRYLAALPPDEAGWLAALRDPLLGQALALIHAEPARPWTLSRLAKEAGTSRSTLAERFTHVVGRPPMHYLALWRMQLAAKQLSHGAAKIRGIALDVGYESEAAFSRAFKKLLGMSPATWRQRKRPG